MRRCGLFDFTFQRFVTRPLIGFFYLLSMFALFAFWVLMIVRAVAVEGDAIAISLVVIGGGFISLIVLIALRLICEALIAIITIAENTRPLEAPASSIGAEVSADALEEKTIEQEAEVQAAD